MFKDFGVWKFPIIHVNTSMFHNTWLGHWRLLHRCYLDILGLSFSTHSRILFSSDIPTIKYLPLAAWYNWCQGPVPGRGPAVKNHCTKVKWCICNHQTHYLLTYSMEQSPSWEADQFSQLAKKFPAFYGTRRFFTVLTSACHLSLSWASSIQSIPPIPLPEDPP
jgi:hypothetical protein